MCTLTVLSVSLCLSLCAPYLVLILSPCKLFILYPASHSVLIFQTKELESHDRVEVATIAYSSMLLQL